MNIQALLSKRISLALIAIGAGRNCKPMVCQSTQAQFGNYQANGILPLAKNLNIPPRILARKVISHLDLTGIANKIEVAGPGFINIFLNTDFLAQHIDLALNSDILGIDKPNTQTIVVDYSAPNIAKEMHVGHLRSTIIGDATVRTLELLGHKVIRANHVGDWGTQFGMLIAYLEKQKNLNEITLINLEKIYRKAKKNFDEDENFASLARSYVVKLQHGDKYFLQKWRKIVEISMSQNQLIYNRLNVTLTQNDTMGESLYNQMLPEIVEDLKIKGIAVESEGATVVFLDAFRNQKGQPMGVIIQKKDGGYLYSTTDIACAKYRYETLHADRILYYIDSRQHQHLMQVWTIVRKAGYIPDSVSLEHHMFGIMLDKDGKPFKTRTGSTIKLMDLLDEAVKRARHLVYNKNPNMPLNELEKVAQAIGIGAIKYADLSKKRTTNYIFDWDNILSFDGNTAPYIQYAYTRILSIFRKAGIDENLPIGGTIIINEDQEVKLATSLLQFEETLNLVANDGTPHVMCSYLYGLAGLFSNFYEHYPILNAKNINVRNSRLKLAQLTAKTIKLGLNTLGIKTIEHM